MIHGLIWFNPLNDLWHSFNLQNNSDGINSFYFCLSYVISSLVVLLHSIHLNNIHLCTICWHSLFVVNGCWCSSTSFAYRSFLPLGLSIKLLPSKRLLVFRSLYKGSVHHDLCRFSFCIYLSICCLRKIIFQQALIQFSDSETASSARNALDGRSIPR